MLEVFLAATLPQARIGALEGWQFDARSRGRVVRIRI
jgi:hypothetical protein